MQWYETREEEEEQVANYVTCTLGHKVYVIWSPERQRFGFTCEQCEEHMERALSLHGLIEVKIVRPGENDEDSHQ